MRLIILTSFLLFSYTILANEEEIPQDIAVTANEGLPSSLVNRSVCAISGEYVEAEVDMILPGPEPLMIHRNYSSGGGGNFGRVWNFSYQEMLLMNREKDIGKDVLCFLLAQPSGARLYYSTSNLEEDFTKKAQKFHLTLPKGLTNCGSGEISGRTNLRNQQATFFPKKELIEIVSGAGHVKTFKRMNKKGRAYAHQVSEKKTNGNGLVYGSPGNREMKALNFATQQIYSSVQITLHEKHHLDILIESDKDKSVEYKFKKNEYKVKHKQNLDTETVYHQDYYLTEVKRTDQPSESFEYAPQSRNSDYWHICSKRKPDDRFLLTSYYHKGKNHVPGIGEIDLSDKKDYRIDRVKTQSAPVGFDQTPIVINRFVYHAKTESQKEGPEKVLRGRTEVYDAYLNRTDYTYTKEHRLSGIERFTKEGALYSSEGYVWDKFWGDLKAKYTKDGSGRIHFARSLSYDGRGNIVVDSLHGHLTGKAAPEIGLDIHQMPIGGECYQKHSVYSEDGLNLLLSEHESRGKITRYVYKPGTDLLIAKMIFCNDQLCMRHFYFYDENAVLVKTIVDDGITYDLNNRIGVTEQRIKSIYPTTSGVIGLPQRVDEMYLDLATGQEVLIKRVLSTYSSKGQLLKEDHYDSLGNYAYSLSLEYDKHGNVIKEVDALGQVVTKAYDKNKNLILKRIPLLDTHYTYDFCNRLIRAEDVHLDGSRFATTHTYDYLGNCVSSVDSYGHEITYQYDEWSRLISIKKPFVPNEAGQLVQPVSFQQYNVLGQITSQTDSLQRAITKQYNSRGQPISTHYPDGTQEKFFYELDGQLECKIGRNSQITRYERDYQGRIIKETIYSRDQELLKSHFFNYNAFHLISSVDAEGTPIHYSYDGAGRLISTTKGDQLQVQFYDSLGRVSKVQSWVGPDQFFLHQKSYDLLNRLVEEKIEDGQLLHLSRYMYDCHGNKIHIQEGEKITSIIYNAYNKPIKITNALGDATHITYNHHFINEYQQRVLQVITTDPLGNQTIEIYDTANRLSQCIRRNAFGVDVSLSKIYYDLCGNKVRLIESVMQEGKVLRQVETIWQYNQSDQLIQVIEAAREPEQKVTRYAYNSYGEKAIEYHPNGSCLFYEYDKAGRLQTFKSSDQTIHYVYEYNRLDLPVKITDLTTGYVNERFYDRLSQLVQEKLGNGLIIGYQYDRLGRLINITLPDQTALQYCYHAIDLKEVRRLGKHTYSHQDLSHNLSGQVNSSQLPGQNGQVNYRYDALQRCIQLSSPHLNQAINQYDAAGNLLAYQDESVSYSFAYDELYQLKEERGHVNHTYQCDSLSNRLKKDDQICQTNSLNQLLRQGDKQYTYDLNGNLVNQDNTSYQYDALNRLISVSCRGVETRYTYDSFNRRLTRKQGGEGGKEQQFFYHGLEEIGLWENGQITELKLLGRNSKAIAIEIQNQVYVPVYDLFGNIKSLADLQGRLIEQYRYTAFGEEEILSPTGEILLESNNPWRYAGKRKDQESGLVAFGLRYYDPITARWVSPDPIGFGDGPNLYAYLHHNPLIYFDAFGLFSALISLDASKFGSERNTNKVTFNDFELGLCNTSKVTFSDFELGLCNTSFEQHVNSCDSMDHLLLLPPPFFCDKSQSYNLNTSFTNPATNQPFNLPDIPNRRIIFINGIQNSFKDFSDSLTYLGTLASHNVVGVHSASFGLYRDAYCYYQATFNNIAYSPVKLLHNEWNDFFLNSSPDATLLHICHSRGAAYTNLALKTYPEHLRQRISVVAIAPGLYIDRRLCKEVVHYVSSWDFVPWIDWRGRMMAEQQGTLIKLPSHAGASWCSPDHSFNSPTFRDAITYEARYYNK